MAIFGRMTARRRLRRATRQSLQIPAFSSQTPFRAAPDIAETQAIPPIWNLDIDQTQVIPAVTDADIYRAPDTTVEPDKGAAGPPVVAESASQRLLRLLAYVVIQEPGLGWAVAEQADGTALLVTDLAHGWIPPGITLPAGVRLLEPGRRAGRAPALVGETTECVTYRPGDSIGRPSDFAATQPSVRPRELPSVGDLGWELGHATHWRDGLPRMVHTWVQAAAGGTGVVEEEVDVLRVHLDTTRYHLLAQYPHVDPALLLNCLLLAATESCVAGDWTSANYHLAWFRKLEEPAASQWSAAQHP